MGPGLSTGLIVLAFVVAVSTPPLVFADRAWPAQVAFTLLVWAVCFALFLLSLVSA